MAIYPPDHSPQNNHQIVLILKLLPLTTLTEVTSSCNFLALGHAHWETQKDENLICPVKKKKNLLHGQSEISSLQRFSCDLSGCTNKVARLQ